MSRFDLLLGDCCEVLADMPDNSVDSVVCDPPYGLSKEPDIAEVMRHWLAGDDYEHSSKGFMGKTWNSFVPGPSVWREVYRVLKLCRLVTPPGGIVLDPFCGSGSTGCAAILEGFDFIGIDTEEEYLKIARARIEHWSKTTTKEEDHD